MRACGWDSTARALNADGRPQIDLRGHMSLRKVIIAGAIAIAASVAAPQKASADWLLTPFIGSSAGGSANVFSTEGSFKNDFEQKLNYGASLAWMGAGIFGVEFDFGYSPNFFGVSNPDATINLVGDGNVTTAMGNLIVGAPMGPVRPYASGGLGLIATKVDSASQFFTNVSSNELGMNVGGGVMFLGEHAGVRGDIRYFRSVTDSSSSGVNLSLADFRFWRATAGVTFRF